MLVCHMTSVHSRYDVRIFSKECVGLAGSGHHACLLVADGRGDEFTRGVAIRDVGTMPSSRFRRMVCASRRFLKRCLQAEADVYHFHDPELIPCGLKLKRRGKKVVYDIHEDVPRQLLSKPYLKPAIARLLAFAVERYEDYAARRFDALVTATPHIRDRFRKLNPWAVDVNNYPILETSPGSGPREWSGRKRQVCYVGALSAIRGLREMMEAGRLLGDGTILLAGKFGSQSLQERFDAERPGNVAYFGFADRKQVAEIMDESMAGLVVFHPAPNHLNAQPNKLFEYMSAGLPVIASSFPSWESLIRETDCGVVVDPLDPAAIARAIHWVFSHPAEAESQGRNGRKAVLEKYSWRTEQDKLIRVYSQLCREQGSRQGMRTRASSHCERSQRSCADGPQGPPDPGRGAPHG